MESLGSEVGQKMRCAVKAKLIELGTGGSSGYIDDELPDYVMIMVANKRSKQQMISDLTLFLGEHTDVFVIWLHEVLQKLQEVTLPTNVIAKGKRKTNENNDITTNKKDKKDKKKDKRQKKSTDKNSMENSEITSITDVFVDHLLQKTKTFPVDTSIVKKKENTEITSYQKQSNNNATDSFDIPTISEMSDNSFSTPTVQNTRERDIAELKDIQKKIYQAKKQLKCFDEHDESEDEDFLNIKEDGEEFDDDVNKTNNGKKNQVKSPIIFERSPELLNKDDKNTLNEPRKRIIYQPSPNQKRENFRQYDNNIKTQKLEKERSIEKTIHKKSVHERLGLKIQRSQQLNEENNSVKRKNNEDNYEENKSKERKYETIKDDKRIDKRKLVSKIIVATQSKPNNNNRFSDVEQEISDDENRDNVKSVIKIKPRPTVSPSRQACKNLLLRAVAEAQKSTTIIPNVRRMENNNQMFALNKTSSSRSQKLYSNSYRARNRKNLIEHAKKDNIVIEVNSNYEDNDEYIPEPISEKGDSESEHIYIPKAIITDISNDEICNRAYQQDETTNKTQFVVTLDDKTGEKYISRNKNSKQIKEKRKLNEGKLQIIKDIVSSNSKRKNNYDEGSTEKSNNIKNYKKPMDLKKLPKRTVSVDTEIESINLNKIHKIQSVSVKGKDESRLKTLTPPLPNESSTPSPKKRKLISVSPIKFDLNVLNNDIQNEKLYSEDKTKIVIKKSSEHSKKYDRIPELLSNISINRSSLKTKLKERCKYFPSCTNSDCEYFHPSGQCKAFPNCKFAENCLYLHPKCKFDLTCNRNGCNFSHSAGPVNVAPPLSSHVVPVQNYKTITATPILPTMCKYYPNCSNAQCNFFHPKVCRFGRNCLNKNECNFYHHEIPSSNKFKWIATSA